MTRLAPEHIDYIIKDLNHRGIVADGIQEELIDHVCSVVETEMNQGLRFTDAYYKALHSFGYNTGLRKIQKDILRSKTQTGTLMLLNYITIAIRNLNKHRFYTLINVVGLATGIAACIIIGLYIVHELSYDRYNTKAGRIARINTEIKFGGNHVKLATGSAPLAEILTQNYPEIETSVRFMRWGPRFVKTIGSNTALKEYSIVWADSTFFTMFSIPLLSGHPGTALKDPNSIAISRHTAEKYFPGGNPLGQSLILNDDANYKVTAVYENIPSRSHFHFDFIVSLSEVKEAKSSSLLGGGDFNIYLLLRKGAELRALEAKFPKLAEKIIAPQLADVMGADFTMEKFHSSGNLWKFSLIPLTDIHLHSNLLSEFEPNNSIVYVYLFSTIALFILFIACVNFMNLSTARSANRAKEVGIRKVLGSLRSHLVRQFLTESFLLSLFSFFIAILIAIFFLPLFNNLAQIQLSLPFSDFSFYAILFLMSVAIGILAGLYPSMFLSAFQPVNVLKGKASLGMKSGLIRSSLVVFQFVISIFLIIGTITIQRQLAYMQNKKIGFEKDQVIVVNEANTLGSNIRSYKDEILKNSFIKSGTISGYLPVSGTWRNADTFWGEGVIPTQENMEDFVNLQKWSVDHDYIKTLGMKIKYGRDFNESAPADSSAVILNETAIRRFNIEDGPIGKKINHFDGQKADGSPDLNKIGSWTVVGVVEDFHFESLKEEITPVAFFLRESSGSVSFRFEAGSTQNVISALESKWKEMAPSQPFKYTFLDEDFNKMYSSEQRLGEIFAVFAGLAIMIACLGLFALSSFTAEQRTKEIGIRKVLGASVSNIVFLLYKEFGKLIFIAFILSVPIAWYAVDWWLKNYTYKVEIEALVYILAGILASLIGWITLGYQSVKAATANPVNSLRIE